MEFPPKPYKKGSPRWRFLFSPKFEVAGFGGVGSGKTIVAIVRTFLYAWGFPENRVMVARKTSTSLKSTTEKEFLAYVRYLNGGNLNAGPVVKSWNKSDHLLTLQNNTEIEFVYFDDIERVMSANVGFIMIDQVEEVPMETYLQAKAGRIRYWNDDDPEAVASWQERWKDHLEKFWGKVVAPKSGLVVIGNPHPGWAKPYFKQREDPKSGTALPHDPDFEFFQINTRDNYENLPKRFQRVIEAQPESWRKRFLDGDWDQMEGQIYPEFDRSIHVVEPFDIPKHWTRIVALDHGYTNPTACICVAVNEVGEVYVYKEYYMAGQKISDNCANIKAMLKGDPVRREGDKEIIWCDPSIWAQGKGVSEKSFADAYREAGIYIQKANNNVRPGIDAIKELLNHTNADGTEKRPKMFIFSDCINLLNEIPAYQWKPKKEGQNSPEEPIKKDDHALDAWRYAIMTYYNPAEAKKKHVKLDKQQQMIKNIIDRTIVPDDNMDMEPFYNR